ncbi:MAG: DUF285 domain-containing protein [Proteobacteria bacterium]|nr:DUF285 domain-containing protein [Pseudomonadota bacterium]
MRRVFVPILVAYACVAFGCSIEPVTCKNDTWACVVSETSEVLSLCVEGAYEPKADPCMAPTPACDVAALKCVAEKVKCKDSCKNGMLAICEDEDTARVTDCAKNGQVCGYDSTKSSYSCVDKVKACDPEKEIYLVDANECACDKRNHWVGEPDACVCEKDYVAVKGNGGMLECEKKVICNSNEIYFEKTNRCECDTARDWGGTAGNCKCQGEKCEEEKVVTCDKSCVSGCQSDGKCKCKDACANDCNDDGSCKNECPKNCKYGCEDDSNQCKCDESCPGNCKENGSCKETSTCPENCKHGCEDDSNQCKCNESCPGNCKADGSCKETSSCPENCKHGCEVDSDQCKCDESCPGNCKADGSCEQEPSTCPENCVNGCEDNSNQCKCPKACSTECDNDGKCLVPGDANANHMLDTYETAPKQGQSCSKHSDCDSKQGANDGFCDSFIGNKCSTRCNNDNQCKNDNYVCRTDGRCAPKVFETVWKVDDVLFEIMFEGGQDVCNYFIDWGDDSEVEHFIVCDNMTHSHRYNEIGEYHIKITGDYHGWKCSTCNMLSEIVSFGTVVFNKEYTFAGAEKLEKVSKIDIPNAKELELNGMFQSCRAFNDDIDNWDVSSVKEMKYTFREAESFSSKLGSWNTGKVTSMAQMFYKAKSFGKYNEDSLINNWNVSNVTDMSEMFYKAQVFNNPINDWDVSSVKNMDSMFEEATLFNQPLDQWNVSKVENMFEMFQWAKGFNQPINTWKLKKHKNGDENGVNLSSMFYSALSYNQPMDQWDTSNVIDFSSMFGEAKEFNQNLSSWTISNDANVSNMFAGSGMNSKNDNGQIYYCEMRKEASWSKFTPEDLGLEPDICE